MSKIMIVGEISDILRAQGNVSATGNAINTSSSSPIVDGQYSIVPQVNIGLMSLEEFSESTAEYTEETGPNTKTPWNSVGAVGLDAIFCPYSTHTNSGLSPYLPYFTAPSGTTGASGVTSNTLNPFNPFFSLSGMLPGGNSISSDPWMSSGHNISFALSSNPDPLGTNQLVDLSFEKDHFARHTVETIGIRSVGLRSPMVLSGWGYDVNGSPVPALSGKIHPEAAWNTNLWKSGPVDLRWDEKRGVWSNGGGSTDSIRFTIGESVCADNYGTERHLLVTVVAKTGGCSGAIPGADPITGEVTVVDPCGHLAGYTDTALAGLCGTATYRYPVDGACEPQWELDAMPAQEGCG